MPFSSDVIDISDSDDDARPLPPSSSQFSPQSQSDKFDLVDLCSSDDELPAPGDPIFFRGVGAGQAKRKRVSASSRSSSVGYPEYIGDSTDEEESPRKVARKVSGVPALRSAGTHLAIQKSDASGSKSPRKSQQAQRSAGDSSDEEDSPPKVVRKVCGKRAP
jgi:hypothetical protein